MTRNGTQGKHGMMRNVGENTDGNGSLLDPLDKIYRNWGLAPPAFRPVEAANLPEPYRNLLVHSDDMTPTLELAYRDRLHLRVMRRRNSGKVELRQVVLVLDRDESPVAFGAIRIHMEHLPEETRSLIREGRLPFGRVLQDTGVEHSSRPLGYFQVLSDAEIGDAFNLSGPHRLYGRRNRLTNASNQSLAEVVEILPPGGPYDANRWDGKGGGSNGR
jgi:chorismate-pyruvate lyase